MKWFKGYRCALSLTFDDGLRSQLNVAVPLLDRYEFNATFYICPSGDDWKNRFRSWSDVASIGHEIGNHTLSHPCPCNPSENPRGHCLENMTLQEIERDILVAQARIEEIAPRKSYTFAYPCYETEVGRGIERRSYVPIVAKYFIAARAGCELSVCANSPKTCDLYKLLSWRVERTKGDTLIGLTIRALIERRWIIFTFHGIDEGHLPVSKYDLEMFLEFLSTYDDEIWIAPVCEIAEHIIKIRREIGIK
ncbi:MAG: hypothetical protein DRJ49_05025 [Thermoprotei archaeon]|nr:MAG: hypothetical protein DRJ49_05025 [Thermoprotei archaeon]